MKQIRPSSTLNFHEESTALVRLVFGKNDFKSGFKPTARPDTEVVIARLEEPHRNTKRAFDFECLAPSSSAKKAREDGGGSVHAPGVGRGAASSAKRGRNGKASGGRIEAGDSGEVDTAELAKIPRGLRLGVLPESGLRASPP